MGSIQKVNKICKAVKNPTDVSSSYICPQCNTAHKVSELVMADNGLDYSYYCKNCGELLESNGVYYGK